MIVKPLEIRYGCRTAAKYQGIRSKYDKIDKSYKVCSSLSDAAGNYETFVFDMSHFSSGMEELLVFFKEGR